MAVVAMGLTLNDITRVYNDEAAAYELLESIRWPNGPVCPHCGSQDAHYIAPKEGASRSRKSTTANADPEKKSVSFRRIYRCHGCKKQYTVLVGTIFGDSHIPLGKWL